MMQDLHPVRSTSLRERLASIIDQAIAMLDALDGAPDAEIETDLDINPISLQGVDRVPAKRITMRKSA